MVCLRLLGGLVIGSIMLIGQMVYAASDVPQIEVPQSKEQITLSFAPLVKTAAPAVVNIYTKTIVNERQVIPLFNDPFFQRFFGGQFGQNFGNQRERVQNSLGSGVIIDGGGIIVTNNHVIEGADKIRVVLSDRREFDATLVGVDDRTDLAVLRIDTSGEKLPSITISDSDALQVGDLVLAIGNPFGVGQTVTSGIVSALARTQVNVADVSSFIQTDAAINPGNSGGALIDMRGQLVGLNTAIFSKSGGSLGIGFAVPSNMVEFVITGLLNHGKVIRPWLGAWGQPVTSDLSDALGLKRPVGILINEIWSGSAAEASGIDVGDVILSINERDVHDPKELEYRIASLAIGGTAKLKVFRDGTITPLSLLLQKAPEQPAKNTTLLDDQSILSGATVANISPALVEELRLESLVPGVIILQINQNSPAKHYRFRPGDRIIELNGALVTSVSHLLDITNMKTGAWDIAIDRNGKQLNLRVSQ